MLDGTVFITRYLDESRNTSPGYWNHSAIYVDNNIVESLRDRGVIKTSFDEWIDGVERCIILRPVYKDLSQKASQYSLKLLGIRYRFISSFFRVINPRRLQKGLNCVSVVKLSYGHALGYTPKWIVPDHIVKSDLFVVEDYK